MDKKQPSPTAAASAATLLSTSGGSSLAQLESLGKNLWSGAVRVRTVGAFGTVWLVKGHCVHAVVKRGEETTSGWEALEQIVQWREGTTFLENDVLPPERSIRLESRDVWKKLADGTVAGRKTAALMDDNTDMNGHSSQKTWQQLRTLSGIVYLSTTQGKKEDHVGSSNEQSRSWVRRCLKAFSDKREVRRLVVENGKRILLVCKSKGLQTVVVARAGTSVQDLLNAVAELTMNDSATDHAAVQERRRAL